MAPGSKAVAPKEASSQQVSRSSAGEVEEYEQHASASAQAGLNLNLFAALSGAFAGKKTTQRDTAADGSSRETTHEEGVGHARGAGGGTMNAVAAARADEGKRASRRVGAEADHLGIEAAK